MGKSPHLSRSAGPAVLAPVRLEFAMGVAGASVDDRCLFGRIRFGLVDSRLRLLSPFERKCSLQDIYDQMNLRVEEHKIPTHDSILELIRQFRECAVGASSVPDRILRVMPR
jgi:hypothetical protein